MVLKSAPSQSNTQMLAQNLSSAIFQLDFSSHAVASLLYLFAAILLGNKNATRNIFRPFQLACIASAAGQLAVCLFKLGYLAGLPLAITELCVLGVWSYALLELIASSTGSSIARRYQLTVLLIWLVSVLIYLQPLIPQSLIPAQLPSIQTVVGPLMATLLILVLVEQLYRNSAPSHQHNLKYLVVGLLALMCFDLYSMAYFSLFQANNPNTANADGLVNMLVGTVFVMGALRTQPEQRIAISRSMAFYSTSLILSGLFLFAMSMAGYFVVARGAAWSAALQLVLFVFTFVALALASLSRTVRAKIRVFVNKHFFRHKYDYRYVWLNLIKTLSDTSERDDFYITSLKAVGEIFESDSGCIWLVNDNGQFDAVGSWNMQIPDDVDVTVHDDFIAPLRNQEWIFAPGDASNSLRDPYIDTIPDWVYRIDDVWVIAPLLIGNELTGFFILGKQRNAAALIWEDLDVLKTVGRQLASYIIRQKSAEQLAESKQFDTYNKLTAFIMHDLKNLIAQQALVVDNANKHKENPAFVEDAIRTIDNSVTRMNHLLKRLQSSGRATPQRSVSIRSTILDAIKKSADRQPIPILSTGEADAQVLADQEQLVMIIMHVLRNAQDATANDGFIDVAIVCASGSVSIEIEDNGAGMDQDFIKNRLFKPFESTKSSMGMGIGAYQVREFIQAMGGQLKVTSEVDVGTNICIDLPISSNEG